MIGSHEVSLIYTRHNRDETAEETAWRELITAEARHRGIALHFDPPIDPPFLPGAGGPWLKICEDGIPHVAIPGPTTADEIHAALDAEEQMASSGW